MPENVYVLWGRSGRIGLEVGPSNNINKVNLCSCYWHCC